MRFTRAGRAGVSLAGFVVAVAALWAPSAMADRPSTRIVGGSAVVAGQFPWQVALIDPAAHDAVDGQFCAGTLVAADRVLTAAHCLDGASSSDVEVLAGASRLSLATSATLYPVTEIARAPGYVPGLDSPRKDLAVLQLGRPVAGAQPLPVVGPETGADATLWAPGAALTVTGWGALSPYAGYAADTLMVAGVTRVTDTACESAYGSSFRVADMVCAGAVVGGDPSKPGAGADACWGDSGGGLIAPTVASPSRTNPAHWKLVGVVSWGESCAQAGYPGVYSRVGAAALNAFAVDPNPVYAPNLVARPTVGGTPAVGQTLTCAPGSFSGTVTETTTMWFVDWGDGDVEVVPEATGSTYTLTDDEAGLGVGCLQRAVGPGGTTYGQSDAIGPVTGGSWEDWPDDPGYVDPATVQDALDKAEAAQAWADAALGAAQAQRALLDEQARRNALTEASLGAYEAKLEARMAAVEKALAEAEKAQAAAAKAKAQAKKKPRAKGKSKAKAKAKAKGKAKAKAKKRAVRPGR